MAIRKQKEPGLINATSVHATEPKWDIKIAIYGNSGCGKTRFAATYTKGPVHFMMFDPQGEKTLAKMKAEGYKTDHITFTKYPELNPENPTAYKSFMDDFDSMLSSGTFEWLLEQQGLLVMDSATTLMQAAIDLTLKEQGKAGQLPKIQDWGIVSNKMTRLLRVLNNLPCATMLLCHTRAESDESNVTRYFPNIVGQLKSSLGIYFGELWYMDSFSNKPRIRFRGTTAFPSSSSLFSIDSITYDYGPSGLTMDHIYDKHMHNKEVPIGKTK